LPEAVGGVKIPRPSAGAFIGIAVDRTNGDVYGVQKRLGVCKSVDQGATFQPPGTAVTSPKAGTMSSFSLNVDPAGKRMACFVIYETGGMTTDAGKTWTPFKTGEEMGKYFDFGAVDWEASGKAILAAVHEGKGKLMLSADAGASWTELGTGFKDKGPIGIFDAKTLLAVKSSKGRDLLRSTDAGANWTKVADLPAGKTGQVIYVLKDVAYLMTESGLLVSKDKGATWAGQGSPVKAAIGPFFGKDADHLAAVGDDGVYETTDAGKTWKLVAPPAPQIGPRDFTYAWDPIHDTFYVAQNGKPAVKCEIKPAPG
jgi:photosystem II stability/assembly factor-like uncharacterized protein